MAQKLGEVYGEVHYAFANVAASSTDAEIVAAPDGKRIRVLAFILQCGDTPTDATFNSKPAGAGTAISMTFQNGLNGGVSAPDNERGWFETDHEEGLTLTTGAGSATGVQVVYAEV